MILYWANNHCRVFWQSTILAETIKFNKMLFMTQINKINYIFIKQIESKAENCVGDLADCKSYTSVVSW